MKEVPLRRVAGSCGCAGRRVGGLAFVEKQGLLMGEEIRIFGNGLFLWFEDGMDNGVFADDGIAGDDGV